MKDISSPVRWVISNSILSRHLSMMQQLTEADDGGLAQRYCLIHRMSIFKGACLVLSLEFSTYDWYLILMTALLLLHRRLLRHHLRA